MEDEILGDLLEVIIDWSFIPLALAVLLVSVVGSGLWNAQWKRTVWVVGLSLLAVAFYFGVQRHEVDEVLFNGQLL
jgi:hypothetical protein